MRKSDAYKCRWRRQRQGRPERGRARERGTRAKRYLCEIPWFGAEELGVWEWDFVWGLGDLEGRIGGRWEWWSGFELVVSWLMLSCYATPRLLEALTAGATSPVHFTSLSTPKQIMLIGLAHLLGLMINGHWTGIIRSGSRLMRN